MSRNIPSFLKPITQSEFTGSGNSLVDSDDDKPVKTITIVQPQEHEVSYPDMEYTDSSESMYSEDDFEDNPLLIKDNNSFWSFIENRLTWRDRTDEPQYNEEDKIEWLRKIFNENDSHEFERILNSYSSTLFKKMNENNLFKNIEHHNKIIICAHCVCKGQYFYEAILNEPEFAEYLIVENEYRDIFPVIRGVSS